MQICPKCNVEVNETDQFCPNCGYNFSGYENNSSKQVKIIIIAIILAVVILAVGKYVYDYFARVNYKVRMEDCAYTMIEGAANAETACNIIVSVWSNSIWKTQDIETDKYTTDEGGFFYEDFNDALDSLFEDEDFLNDLREINDNLEEVNDEMRELQNPPKGCSQMHDAFMDFYDAYYELVNCALDPTGNLESYSNDFSDADEDSAKYFDKLKVYFE
ncbi:zinc ribbon domain-containing protein [Pseudobutyrivibrio xylanivorans]|uniref:Zinc-ribbon domain-containing protein n=1 Tax=Pseudobutyrivibrio xylanivorans DSM 14809 TaxID=1123012 RepID=A0A1M6L974_PSEXY|nr:zinc ribbon domain-containing protein [Pseudobutyrivibrio xylanivorans]SHJ67703.1 zinc-ribbon domain-containing protein [Pseudobutyrivibrio xylanivorans DSM 14809]